MSLNKEQEIINKCKSIMSEYLYSEKSHFYYKDSEGFVYKATKRSVDKAKICLTKAVDKTNWFWNRMFKNYEMYNFYFKFTIIDSGNTLVEYSCKHGTHKTKAINLLKNVCCSSCKNSVRNEMNWNDKVNSMSKLHEHKYDYSYSKIPEKESDKFQVYCKDHGLFYTSIETHLNKGYACKFCSAEKAGKKRRLTKESWVSKFKGIYGDRYDYSLIENMDEEYFHSLKKIPIICNVYGLFYQSKDDHKNYGCSCCVVQRKLSLPESSENSFSKLYLAKISYNSEDFYKIGITKYGVDRRFKRISRTSNFSAKEVFVFDVAQKDTYDAEKFVLSYLIDYKFIPKSRFAGMSECFCFGNDSIAEQLFKDAFSKFRLR